MDREWIEALDEALGKRYRFKIGTDVARLEYRRGKAEFHDTRVEVGGDGARRIRLALDVRIPAGTDASEADAVLEALETQTMTPRGFARVSDETTEMTNQRGESAGSARNLAYETNIEAVDDARRHLRAILESLDLPVIIGIHDEADLVARDPIAPPPKPTRRFEDKLDELRFRLVSGMSHDLSVFVDQNNRTLRVMERKLLSSRQIGDVRKLAHIARLLTRSQGDQVELVAVSREGDEAVLASARATPEFTSTVQRLAQGVRIPFGAPG